MRHWFERLKLSRQLALVSCLFLLIPMLLLWFTILRGQRDSAVQSRLREAQSRCAQVQAQVQRAAELCNMSTQVFLNTPALVDHLHRLKLDLPPETAELLEFYRTDISSLEKITLSNPDLYQIRVYAEVDGIHEMMPILYSHSRMERMPWAEEEVVSGSWHLDFDDQLFDNYPVTPHIMSLVTAITSDTTSAQERVGVLEVAVRMDTILPGLFSGTEANWAVLVDGSGDLRAGRVPGDGPLPDGLAQLPDGVPGTQGKAQVLVTRSYLRELDYIKNYVALMNLRFDYVVGLKADIPLELLGQLIPNIRRELHAPLKTIHHAPLRERTSAPGFFPDTARKNLTRSPVKAVPIYYSGN